MDKNFQVNVQGTNLTVLDFGGKRTQDILLLHGLAGWGGEWESTAEWLINYGRVLALDQRGHGKSQSNTNDYSRRAYIQDAIQVIEQCCDKPIVLIGQSMGGLNAFLVAAKRPDLVKTLIIVEATPERNPKAQTDIRNWLTGWPIPFPTLDAAKEFFGGETLYSRTFTKSLVKHEGGYWPSFTFENMVRSLDDIVANDYWTEWQKINCPTFVVAGENSSISQPVLQRMVDLIPDGAYTYIENAGHDLHLENPEAWQKTVKRFLTERSS